MLAQAANDYPLDNPPWTAVAVIAIGAVALWIGQSIRSQNESGEKAGSWESRNYTRDSTIAVTILPLERRGWRLAAFLLAVALTIAVLWRMPHMLPQDSYGFVALAWGAAIMLYLAAVAEPVEFGQWKTWIHARSWRPVLVVANIVLFAFLVRLWRVGTIPFTLSGDEASQGLEALRVLQGEIRNPFSTGWLGVPTMSFFYNSISLNLFGRSIFALRLSWVVVGAMTVLTTFLLVRRLFGVYLALVSAALLAAYHYHIHYSRLGSNQIADPLFLSLALFFLIRALDGKKWLDWALAGTICGLAFYVYAGARLTPIILTAVLFYWFLLNPRRFWPEHKWGLVVGLVAFFIVAAPMLQYAYRFPGEFNARLNQVGIFQSGWLEREMDLLGQPLWAVLYDQFRRAALAFHYYPDRTVWYGLKEPLLDPIFGAIFLLGLIYGTLQLFNRRVGPRVAPMVAWWWGGMILGGLLTESPPSSQRLITLAVPVSFFIAYAMWELVGLAGQRFKSLPAGAVITIGVLLFASVSFSTYFVDYTPQQFYGGRNAEMATEIAPRLNELKDENRFYFIGAPWMYWGFATLPYLVPGAEARDILEPLTEPIPENLVAQDKGALFIVIPPRIDELELLVRRFPQGVREEVYSSSDGRHMVTLFKVPP